MDLNEEDIQRFINKNEDIKQTCRTIRRALKNKIRKDAQIMLRRYTPFVLTIQMKELLSLKQMFPLSVYNMYRPRQTIVR
jgi:hypothetical protein